MRCLLCLIALLCSQVQAQDLALFKKRVDTLASPSMAGRGYVNRTDTLAANYIAHEFEEIGLQKIEASFFQPFPIKVNTFPGDFAISLNGKELTPGEDFICSPNSGGGSGTFKTYYPGTANADKIFEKGKHTELVAILHDSTLNKLDQFQLFKLYQSKAILVVKKHKLTAAYAKNQLPIPQIELKPGNYSNIKKVTLKIEAKEWSGKSQNVIGLIQGKESDTTLIISGHYDHLGKMGSIFFPGANDNASGIAMLLALAEYFKKNDNLLHYNLMFIAFGGEEAGLIGSKHYVEHPLVPLEKTKAQITLDLFGAGTKGMTVVNAPANPSLFKKINAVNSYLPEIKSRKQAANSDHYFFDLAGVPSIFLYTMGDLTAYHDIDDKPEILEYDAYDRVFNLLKDYINSLQKK